MNIDTKNLIVQVSDHPEIWDTANESYKDKNVKNDAFQNNYIQIMTARH